MRCNKRFIIFITDEDDDDEVQIEEVVIKNKTMADAGSRRTEPEVSSSPSLEDLDIEDICQLASSTSSPSKKDDEDYNLKIYYESLVKLQALRKKEKCDALLTN
jgi:hypothetical protein